MRYEDLLVNLLQPLGVYSFQEHSFSLGEWQALGDGLDECCAAMQDMQAETIVSTASEMGLEQYEALFRSIPPENSVAARRLAIQGFLCISGDSFTKEALEKCLNACGTQCALSEPGDSTVKVRFPNVMGYPTGLEWKKQLIEEILPCHLRIEYDYRWCTWGECRQYGLLWADVSKMSWYEWETYRE